MSGAVWSLERLLHPVQLDVLFEQHWESAPLYIPRDDAGYYATLMSLENFDDLLATSSLRGGMIRLVGGAEEESSTEAPSIRGVAKTGGLADVYEQFRDGSTVVLPMLHERWPPLRSLCSALAGTLGVGMQANAYLTPPHAQGLDAHYDTHDVFVVQLSGDKLWRLYDSPTVLPTLADPYRPERHAPTGEARTIHVRAGDLLYVPRGVVHEAVSADSTSLHLAVGVLTIAWIDVFREALQAIAASEPALREGLPPGFNRTPADDDTALSKAHHLVELVTSRLVPAELVALADRRAQSAAASATPWHGRLLDLDQEPNTHLGTELWRRGIEPWHFTSQDDRLILEVGTRRLSMPADLEDDLRWLSRAAEPFAAGDLPGHLHSEERLVLTRRLLREGFITARPASN